MTLQEIFDKVALHLLTQRRRSVSPYDDSFCRYRGDGNCMCAVGVLITDEAYSIILEGKTANSPIVLEALVKSGVLKEGTRFADEAPTMLRGLQNVHDNRDERQWDIYLQELAEAWKLDSSVVTNFKLTRLLRGL